MIAKLFGQSPRSRIKRVSWCVALWVAGLMIAMGSPTTADACNLLENPEFTTDLGSWDTTTPPAEGTWSWAAGAGHGAPGSAHCDDPDSCTIWQCVDVSGYSHPTAATYWISLAHTGQVGSLTLSAWLLPTTDCSGFGTIADTTEWFMPPVGWGSYQSGFNTLGDTQSILVMYTASYIFGGNPISPNVDDGGLCLQSSELVFSDGFENGDPFGWSSWLGY